jgi:hypothetical protein
MPLLLKPSSPFQQVLPQPFSQAPTLHPNMTTELNPWEEQALRRSVAGHLSNPQVHDPFIYPGLYSTSGLDILTILVSVSFSFSFSFPSPNPCLHPNTPPFCSPTPLSNLLPTPLTHPYLPTIWNLPFPTSPRTSILPTR